MSVWHEIWGGVRPGIVRHATNFLNEFVKYLYGFMVSCSIWLFLFLFKKITDFFPASGWIATLIVGLHDLGILAAMANLVWFIVNDIIQSRRGGVVCFA